MDNFLKGKVVLVTGGSRGLGAATAEALAERGANVAISYVSSEGKARMVVQRLEEKGVHSLAIQSDQGDLSAADSLIERVMTEFGRLDILINNAGITSQGQLVDDPELDRAAHDRLWQVNVLGTVATTRAAAPRLTNGGRIIFVGSLLGSHVPFTGVADYAGTKAALAGYAKGVARDLGPRRITANVVHPGVMPTDMSAQVLGEPPEDLLNLHPIHRIATLEEVAQTICFLVGPSAGYITGEAINIAGGLGV